MISERELVARVVGCDDGAAFQQLVVRHQGAIRGFLGRLLAGDHATADDLAQETFLLAYRKLAGWKGEGSLISWLHSIAYRQFLQHLRRHGRQDVMPGPPDAGHDPTPAMEAEILLPVLLRQVGPEERACLTLAYAAGMSHPEIVAVTALPLGTVKSHISRGRQKLQQWLRDHDHSLSMSGSPPASEANHA